jgi:hypothetical protein
MRHSETRPLRESSRKKVAPPVYKAWHKNKVALYVASIRAEAVVEPDLIWIHPSAVPIVTKQSHCMSVVIRWNVARTAAVDMAAMVGPAARGNYRKQAATKKGLFDDWSEQRVDKYQVPEVNHISG